MSRSIQLVAFLLYASTNVFSADDQANAVTSVANAGSDFRFVGEYAGNGCSANGRRMRFGIQVVALGDGKFSGMLYHGGLPGSGWNRQEREIIVGQRDGSVLKLASQSYRIRIEYQRAAVSHTNGRTLAIIQKVRRRSLTMHRPAPRSAVVLYNGNGTDAFKNGRVSEDGHLIAGTELKEAYGDFAMHLEFRVPYMPLNKSQSRGNSGVYINSRYEVQILDSFGLEGKPNECGGLYRQRAPDQNMALPPLAWQTYDICFRTPRFDCEGKKIQNARIRVMHNGIVIHNFVELTSKTGAGKKEGPNRLPIKLQAHGSPVHYRNIWLVDLDCCQRRQAKMTLASPFSIASRRFFAFWPGPEAINATNRTVYQ